MLPFPSGKFCSTHQALNQLTNVWELFDVNPHTLPAFIMGRAHKTIDCLSFL